LSPTRIGKRICPKLKTHLFKEKVTTLTLPIFTLATNVHRPFLILNKIESSLRRNVYCFFEVTFPNLRIVFSKSFIQKRAKHYHILEGKCSFMVKVTYVSGDASLIDRVAPLWTELNKQHLSLSPYFKDYYRTLTFEDRKRAILQRASGGEVRVDLALDASGTLIGYCVSSIDRWLTGEIDSIFVSPPYRGQGIGTTLMEKTLEWLNSKGTQKNIVSIAVGNEQAYIFYSEFGFFPRRTLLEQKKR
jgi:ribosomal protein S18 acetylase RimI-like enzyme